MRANCQLWVDALADITSDATGDVTVNVTGDVTANAPGTVFYIFNSTPSTLHPTPST